MKKLTAIIALAFVLTACAKTETPTGASPPTETTSSETTTSETTTISEEDMKYMLTGAYGETLDLREANEIYYPKWNDELKNEEKVILTVEEALTANWYIVGYNSFCYAAKPSGICYSTVDNPDMFEYEEGFPHLKEDISYEYKFERVNVGETYSGLTVKEANYAFSVQSGNFSELVYSGMLYEGEMTMSGYATCSLMSEGYMLEGDIYFYPEKSPNIPFLTKPHTSLGLNWLGSDIDNLEDRLWFYSDTGYMSLGSVFDEKYAGINIPTDGSIFRVTVTIRNLTQGYSETNFVPERAEKSEVLKISVD